MINHTLSRKVIEHSKRSVEDQDGSGLEYIYGNEDDKEDQDTEVNDNQ
jgi:hypothetical protein